MHRQLKTIYVLASFIALTACAATPTDALGSTIRQTTHKTLNTLESPDYTPLGKLDYSPFPYKPMGTYPNSYPPGQCTYGVASMKGNITWSGNANEWANQARARGITVSNTPIVGSVADDTSGYYGHVAVVIGVGKGTVTVREMNWNWVGGVRSFTYPVSRFVYIWM